MKSWLPVFLLLSIACGSSATSRREASIAAQQAADEQAYAQARRRRQLSEEGARHQGEGRALREQCAAQGLEECPDAAEAFQRAVESYDRWEEAGGEDLEVATYQCEALYYAGHYERAMEVGARVRDSDAVMARRNLAGVVVIEAAMKRLQQSGELPEAPLAEPTPLPPAAAALVEARERYFETFGADGYVDHIARDNALLMVRFGHAATQEVFLQEDLEAECNDARSAEVYVALHALAAARGEGEALTNRLEARGCDFGAVVCTRDEPDSARCRLLGRHE